MNENSCDPRGYFSDQADSGVGVRRDENCGSLVCGFWVDLLEGSWSFWQLTALSFAIVALLEGPKTVAEGAGATSVAAWLFEKVDLSLKTVALVSGGNVDITTLSRIITKGLQKTGRIVRLKTKLADRPGSLAKLLELVTASGANILGIEHEREDLKTEVNSCVVSMTLETRDMEHVYAIRRDMRDAGYVLFE